MRPRNETPVTRARLSRREIACNQLERIKNQFEWKFKQLDAVDEKAGGDASRHVVYALCREAQHIYASEREAALQAAQWARQLAARLQRAPPPAFVPQRGAIFVSGPAPAPHPRREPHPPHPPPFPQRSLMRLRDSVVAHTREIVWRSAAVQAPPPDGCEADAAAARVRELLLQAHRLSFEVPPAPPRPRPSHSAPAPTPRTCVLFAAAQRTLQIRAGALPAAGGEVLQETARVPPADQAESDRIATKEARDDDH